MNLALFDLDHTLVSLDTNQQWVLFLVKAGLLPEEPTLRQCAHMEARYREGTGGPDVEFCNFFAGLLVQVDPDRLHRCRDEFLASVVAPAYSPLARDCVQRHRAAGDVTTLVTATHEFLAEPIAALCGLDHCVATRLEKDAHGRYTGKIAGEPCMREGKQRRMAETPERLRAQSVVFYSDSINDLPLLLDVDTPVAVDPDPALHRIATQRHWRIEHWHGSAQ